MYDVFCACIVSYLYKKYRSAVVQTPADLGLALYRRPRPKPLSSLPYPQSCPGLAATAVVTVTLLAALAGLKTGYNTYSIMYNSIPGLMGNSVVSCFGTFTSAWMFEHCNRVYSHVFTRYSMSGCCSCRAPGWQSVSFTDL